MERLGGSKLSHLASKIAVESEPGLTTTQLLLTNGEFACPIAGMPAETD